jgi:hypothetical protein
MEVYEYEVTKYDPHTREGGLFADYIKTFLKLKAEAGGNPRGYKTPRTRNVISRFSMLEKACCWTGMQ